MDTSIAQVHRYHEQTKHSTQAYAPSPGFLDWDAQPNPFRHFEGAKRIYLPLKHPPTDQGQRSLNDLYQQTYPAQSLSLASLSLFLELGVGLSAWKTTGNECWSLRHNASSGNLHPTETYLILWADVDDRLLPGVYHYYAYEHCLELRSEIPCELAKQFAQEAAGSWGAIALTSIHWREEWKYGARALRYCQLDAGHAFSSLNYSAALQGWRLDIDTQIYDSDIRRCLGLDTIEQHVEQEHPDLLAYLTPQASTAIAGSSAHSKPLPEAYFSRSIDYQRLTQALSSWHGVACQLSEEHAHWPQIKAVLPALEKTAASFSERPQLPISYEPIIDDHRACAPAEKIIRRRRSAQRMQLGSGTTKAVLFNILARLIPNYNRLPYQGFNYSPCISHVVFIHQVDGMAPGIYYFCPSSETLALLKAATEHKLFSWHKVTDHLPLYALDTSSDVRKIASKLSCYQAIAGHSAFSLGMLADLETLLQTEGAWSYRRIFWEAGLIGQCLYLEAENHNLQGMGIGCYFDDSVQQLLGIEHTRSWQSFYHFTVGHAKLDERLTTLSGYHHIKHNQR